MGTAAVQGELWGERARDWADLVEGGQTPFYEATFDRLDVGNGFRLLDAGCGAGLALTLAAERGAVVSGLDASAGLLSVAAERLPGADLRQGELEELPFADGSFDGATSFNAVQYAADPVRVLRELGRVIRDGATIAIVVWGAAEQCEMRNVLAAIGSVLPPPPPGAAGPFALSVPGALEAVVESAGLRVRDAFAVPTPFEYPDVDTAVRAQSASGPAIRAIRHAGEPAVDAVLRPVMTDHGKADGSVRFDNVFRGVLASA
jgi:SAM-dependent methyltransferase